MLNIIEWNSPNVSPSLRSWSIVLHCMRRDEREVEKRIGEGGRGGKGGEGGGREGEGGRYSSIALIATVTMAPELTPVKYEGRIGVPLGYWIGVS